MRLSSLPTVEYSLTLSFGRTSCEHLIPEKASVRIDSDSGCIAIGLWGVSSRTWLSKHTNGTWYVAFFALCTSETTWIKADSNLTSP